ncbi:translation initiation factor IF-6 [Candidatus Woesearchaeota archaeon]|nr:translation initiation factor IF-6 [Candidatus Woesearchaeota archaeon]
MKVDKISFNGNFNIGLFAYANDSFCLVGSDVPERIVEIMKKVLDVPVHQISIAGTSLIGVFVAGNSNSILVPQIIYPDEIALLKKLKIKHTIVNTTLSALGNNILCNDNGAIINPEFEDEAVAEISKALKVDVKKGTIEELNTVGSLGFTNNRGAVVSKDITTDELDFVSNQLKVNTIRGTVNLGNNYISSGVIANNKGLLIGSATGGVEITDIDNTLIRD